MEGWKLISPAVNSHPHSLHSLLVCLDDGVHGENSSGIFTAAVQFLFTGHTVCSDRRQPSGGEALHGINNSTW